MRDLYVVINGTKDGKYLGECPMLKYSISGYSLAEVKDNVLKAVRIYLENGRSPINDEVSSNVPDEKVIKRYRGLKRSGRTVVPKW